ncbi:MAG: polymer-forming cytoskeletal protein [Bacillota bacterium]
MFKKDNLETPMDKVNTVIGKETSFNGTINGNGLIRIDGEADGQIYNYGDVIVGEGGRVSVELKAHNVTIAGHYEGTLEAEGRLELKKTGKAIGTFKVNGLLVEEGALLAGKTEMPDADKKTEKGKKEPIFNKSERSQTIKESESKEKEKQMESFSENVPPEKSF